MNKRISALLIASFILGFPSLRVEAKPLDEIALVVDGETMTQSELDENVQNFFITQRMKVPPPQSPEYQQALKQVMDDFIEQVLLAEEADRQKIPVTDGEIDHAVNQQIEAMKKSFGTEEDFQEGMRKEGLTEDDLRQNTKTSLLRRLKSNRALRAKQDQLPQKTSVSEEQARAYYDQHPAEYEQALFSMILFRIPPDAKPQYAKEVQIQAAQVIKELRAGASFAAYAKKYSEDPGSAEKGGDVGSVFRSQMPPALAKGIFSIPEKSLGTVKTADAVYVIKLTSKGMADYASVAPASKDHLKKEGLDGAVRAWLKELRRKAFVEYHHKILPPDTAAPAPAKNAPVSLAEEEPQVQVFSTASDAPSMGANLLPGSTSEISNSSGPSNLPEEGSLALNFRLNGWAYNTQDLNNYYIPNYSAPTTSLQDFPFGFDFSMGLDLAVDPNFQLGLQASVISKTVETAFNPTMPLTVNSVPAPDHWKETALGASLALKLIFPLEDGVNAVLGGTGGYYFLTSSNVNDTPIEGGDLGADAQGSLEFFLDNMKATALELGAGYRYLQITANGLPKGPAVLDFSGLEFGVGLKIYLGK